jgi:hypothetical protein
MTTTYIILTGIMALALLVEINLVAYFKKNLTKIISRERRYYERG